MRVSTRINGRVTSISIKDSVAALHYTICNENDTSPENHIQDVCHTIIGTWEGNTARGLSSFICDAMIEDLLESDDKKMYFKTFDTLRSCHA